MAPTRTRLMAIAAGAAWGALAASASAAPASSGHGGWLWSNPSPTGETLEAVAFTGLTGWASGVDGALLRSDDGGYTWRGLASGTTTSLTDLTPLGAGGFTVSGGCAAWRADGGLSPTGSITFAGDTACGTQVRTGAFLDARRGYLLATTGALVVTSDGGRSFSRRTSLPGSTAAGGSGTASGLAVAPDGALVGLVGSDIVRSTDGGYTWVLAARASSTVEDVAFPAPGVGYAVGEGQLLASRDGGVSWVAQPASAAVGQARRIACADALVCVIGDRSSPRVLRTVDGGATVTASVPTGGLVRDVAFAGATRVIAVGSNGLIATSDDAGATWATRRDFVDLTVTRMVAENGGLVSVGPNGIVLRSSDGVRWVNAAVPTTAEITGASFARPGVGYAVDTSGAVFITRNEGQSWRTVRSGLAETRGLTASGRTVFVWGRSALRRSRGGGPFGPVRLPFARGSIVDVQVRGGRTFLVTERAAWRSDRFGRTWTEVDLPADPRDLDCAARGVCWMVSDASRVYLTRNAGGSWRDVTAAVGRPHDGSRIQGVAASSARVAVVSTTSGRVFTTRNGGVTFAPQRVSPAELRAVTASGSLLAALDARGYAFVTRTAGNEGPPARLTLAARGGAGTSVVLRGRLTPAVPGAQVAITSTRGKTYLVDTDSRGRFARRVAVPDTASFVAQWEGDSRRAGVGTRVVRVTR